MGTWSTLHHHRRSMVLITKKALGAGGVFSQMSALVQKPVRSRILPDFRVKSAPIERLGNFNCRVKNAASIATKRYADAKKASSTGIFRK
ncbi:hypothetical protein BH11PSE11_BH11PSE11_23300 [soil metagenome]